MSMCSPSDQPEYATDTGIGLLAGTIVDNGDIAESKGDRRHRNRQRHGQRCRYQLRAPAARRDRCIGPRCRRRLPGRPRRAGAGRALGTDRGAGQPGHRQGAVRDDARRAQVAGAHHSLAVASPPEAPAGRPVDRSVPATGAGHRRPARGQHRRAAAQAAREACRAARRRRRATRAGRRRRDVQRDVGLPGAGRDLVDHQHRAGAGHPHPFRYWREAGPGCAAPGDRRARARHPLSDDGTGRTAQRVARHPPAADAGDRAHPGRRCAHGDRVVGRAAAIRSPVTST